MLTSAWRPVLTNRLWMGYLYVKENIYEKKMRKKILFFTLLILSSLSSIASSGSFKVYPGAQVEEIYEQTETAGKGMTRGPKVIVFTTNDFFENVVAFYRSHAREYRMPGGGKSVKLSTGQELKEAYFILDGAGDIMTSKHWIKVQRPYIAREQMKNSGQGKYGVPRNVTAIIEEDKRSYP